MNSAEQQVGTIATAWPNIVGADLAKDSRPIGIYNHALVVETTSTAIMQILAFLGSRIVEEVPKYAADVDVTRLRFRCRRIRSKA